MRMYVINTNVHRANYLYRALCAIDIRKTTFLQSVLDYINVMIIYRIILV